MAIYSLSITPASRGDGKSAIAMAAYRSGERLLDRLTGEICDYTRKAGIVLKEIFCPQGIKIDRQDLWNMAEEAEKRKDSRIAREIRIALPHELDEKKREKLAREFAQNIVNRYGIAVDLSIHLPDKKGDHRNHHAHLLLTTRQICKEGLCDKSDLERSDKYLRQHGLKSGKEQIQEIRDSWEIFCNRALERRGLEERISAKSYKDQGIDREPTIHMGPAATEMERRGIETDKGIWNRIIEKNNSMRILQREFEQLELNYRKAKEIILEAKNKIIREIRTVFQKDHQPKEEQKTLTSAMEEKRELTPEKDRNEPERPQSLSNELKQREEQRIKQERATDETRHLSLQEQIELKRKSREQSIKRDKDGYER